MAGVVPVYCTACGCHPAPAAFLSRVHLKTWSNTAYLSCHQGEILIWKSILTEESSQELAFMLLIVRNEELGFVFVFFFYL